jgi:nucleoside-diphosphate-sugar epimerase
MDVLIIGGTGLISTGITRQLADGAHEVTCFTRGESEARVPDDVEFVYGDRNDGADLAAARDEVDPDCVIDMVCFSPDQAEQAVDVFGGEVEQFVFCSTVDVYHRPLDTNPVQEDAPREPPVSDYGADKAECEDLFMAAHDRGDFETTVIRPWCTYGEGGTVLHTLGQGSYFLDRIRQGKPVVIHGDGQTLWGPCHRDDVARAFVNAVGNETAYGEAYHVTSEENITWGQFYGTVADVMDAPDPELVHIPTEILAEAVPDRTGMLLDHFQFSTVFVNSKARRDLDFEYTITFEEGVRRTIEWLEERGEIEDWDSENDDELIQAWREATGKFLDSVAK